MRAARAPLVDLASREEALRLVRALRKFGKTMPRIASDFGVPSLMSLVLLFILPLPVALPLYVCVVVLSGCARRMIARTVDFPPLCGLESMPGGEAVVVSSLDPVGVVRYRGELWRAASGAAVQHGRRVRIVRVERQPEGLTVLVEAVMKPVGTKRHR